MLRVVLVDSDRRRGILVAEVSVGQSASHNSRAESRERTNYHKTERNKVRT